MNKGMYITIMTDEFGEDVYKVLPEVAKWGMKYVDFRGLINGRPIEKQTKEELHELKRRLDFYDLKTGVIDSSLCKVNLPDKERLLEEMEKLEGVIRASEILECNWVRSFNCWQSGYGGPRVGELATRPDMLMQVAELFEPFRKRAREAGLILGFENCGQTMKEVTAFLKTINEPGWGLCWDIWNDSPLIDFENGDCTDYFTEALSYANMLHVKANCVSTLPELDYMKAPWERILAGAAALKREIPVVIEAHNPSEGPLGGKNREVCHRIYDYLTDVWPEETPADLKTALEPENYFDRPYKDNPVNMVVVGLGMGAFRSEQITKTPGMKLYGVCDINPEKAKETGEKFQVPYSTDIDVYLKDPAVEAMYIVTPTGLHCEVAMRCLEAGKHVLMTKPMDASLEACDRAIALAEEKGLILAIDFDQHFGTTLPELQKAVEKGYFGKLKSASILLNVHRTDEYYRHNGGWRGTWKYDGGGALSNQGIHEIDRLISVFGMPKRVRAITKRQTFAIEAEDWGSGDWEYDSGLAVHVCITTGYPASDWYNRVEVYGDEGAYLLLSGGPEGSHVYWWKDGGWSEKAPYPCRKEWRQGSDNFAYCLRMNEKPKAPAEAGRRSRYLLDKMYESSGLNGIWITI